MKTITKTQLPEIKTALPGPKATEILNRDAKYISPSYTRSYPLVAARGYGAIIEDVDGNKFLDFNAGVAVAPGVGFGERGDGYVRFALVENEQRIAQAVRGIKSFLHDEPDWLGDAGGGRV